MKLGPTPARNGGEWEWSDRSKEKNSEEKQTETCSALVKVFWLGGRFYVRAARSGSFRLAAVLRGARAPFFPALWLRLIPSLRIRFRADSSRPSAGPSKIAGPSPSKDLSHTSIHLCFGFRFADEIGFAGFINISNYTLLYPFIIRDGRSVPCRGVTSILSYQKPVFTFRDAITCEPCVSFYTERETQRCSELCRRFPDVLFALIVYDFHSQIRPYRGPHVYFESLPNSFHTIGL